MRRRATGVFQSGNVTQRYLIFECGENKGLGDVLLTILNLAHYARQWNRVLALDLRGFQYFDQDAHRRFFESFAISVPDAVFLTNELDVIDELYGIPSYRLITGIDEIDCVKDFTEEVVVCSKMGRCDQLYTLDEKSNPPEYAIRLKGDLQRYVESKLATISWEGSIGIHFRHGNGEFLGTRFDAMKASSYEDDYTTLKDCYVERAGQLQRQSHREESKVFVAGDNAAFVAEMLSRVPLSFTFDATLPDQPYQKHLKLLGKNPEILWEAVLDLWSLSCCQYLVCGESLFTDFAALNSEKLTWRHLTLINTFSVDELLRNGDLERAQQVAENTLEFQPENITMLSSLAKALMLAGKSECHSV